MRRGIRILGWWVALLFAVSTASAAELAGTWQGKLQIDKSTALTIYFTFAKKPDGSYSAVLDSPENGAIKNVSANAVALDKDAVKVRVDALNGAFAGTLKSASLEGQWTQEGKALPLVLTPKAAISKAVFETLVGAWNGPLHTQVGTLTFVVRFKANPQGDLQGTLAVPEQGGIELPLTEIAFVENRLTFKVPTVAGDFSANYTDGVLKGNWKQAVPGFPGTGLPVDLKKGEIKAQAPVLKLSNEAFVAIGGHWEGTLSGTAPDGKKIELPLVVRLETDTAAQYIGFLDSPAQKATGIPLTEASVTGNKVVLKAGGIGAEYRADLKGDTLTGQWIQGPVNYSLTMTRSKK